MEKAPQIYIGTSGWSYKHWMGTFYPEGTKPKELFAYYLSQFDTVEINSSFYHLPKKETLEKWYHEVASDFTFVLKASRYITHMKKLRGAEESLNLFLEHASLLKEKLGAVLFQLPPSLKKDLDLLEEFLKLLPTDLRYVFKFRNASWYDDGTYRLLSKYNCAFCIYELAGHQSPMAITADFVYLRLHGPGNKYQGNYDDETLKTWAQRCINWSKEKHVFVYFDNDEQAYAAHNAKRLKEFV